MKPQAKPVTAESLLADIESARASRIVLAGMGAGFREDARDALALGAKLHMQEAYGHAAHQAAKLDAAGQTAISLELVKGVVEGYLDPSQLSVLKVLSPNAIVVFGHHLSEKGADLRAQRQFTTLIQRVNPLTPYNQALTLTDSLKVIAQGIIRAEGTTDIDPDMVQLTGAATPDLLNTLTAQAVAVYRDPKQKNLPENRGLYYKTAMLFSHLAPEERLAWIASTVPQRQRANRIGVIGMGINAVGNHNNTKVEFTNAAVGAMTGLGQIVDNDMVDAAAAGYQALAAMPKDCKVMLQHTLAIGLRSGVEAKQQAVLSLVEKISMMPMRRSWFGNLIGPDVRKTVWAFNPRGNAVLKRAKQNAMRPWGKREIGLYNVLLVQDAVTVAVRPLSNLVMPSSRRSLANQG